MSLWRIGRSSGGMRRVDMCQDCEPKVRRPYESAAPATGRGAPLQAASMAEIEKAKKTAATRPRAAKKA
jgi:hypothetical protein